MITVDLGQMEGRRYPARRRTQNLVGGASPIQADALLHRQRDPGSQRRPGAVAQPGPGRSLLHLEGTGEMCLGEERQVLTTGQAAYIPPGVFHQLTNIGDTPLRMLYCYGPAGEVAHWRQELIGHAAQGRHRSAAAAAGRLPTVYGKTS